MNKDSPTGRNTAQIQQDFLNGLRSMGQDWVSFFQRYGRTGVLPSAVSAAEKEAIYRGLYGDPQALTESAPILSADYEKLEARVLSAESVRMKNGSEIVFYGGGRCNGKTDFWRSWHDAIQRREEGHRDIMRAIFKLWPR